MFELVELADLMVELVQDSQKYVDVVELLGVVDTTESVEVDHTGESATLPSLLIQVDLTLVVPSVDTHRMSATISLHSALASRAIEASTAVLLAMA